MNEADEQRAREIAQEEVAKFRRNIRKETRQLLHDEMHALFEFARTNGITDIKTSLPRAVSPMINPVINTIERLVNSFLTRHNADNAEPVPETGRANVVKRPTFRLANDQ